MSWELPHPAPISDTNLHPAALLCMRGTYFRPYLGMHACAIEVQHGNENSSSIFYVFLQIIYIGGNPYFSNIRDCLNAHFSGNDGLPIGRYLSGPGKKRWKYIAVRWMTCLNPPEIVYYLLEDYQNRHGGLPIYNNAPNVDSRDWESD